jgi:outer membrane protein OmpA-like peptidoglycan-associated protein
MKLGFCSTTSRKFETFGKFSQRIIIFSLIFSFITIGFSKGQCLRMTGKLVDVNTQNPIQEAVFYSIIDKTKKEIGRISGKTDFQISLPCDAQILGIESPNYRPVQLKLNHTNGKNGGNAEWYFPIFLVSKDLQAIDKPYAQNEQKHFEMKSKKDSAQSQPFVSRIFKVTDALNPNEMLDAQICLFYTKSGKKDCFEIAQNTYKELTFSDLDIVAFEVKGNGYQTYNGNLILDKLDGQQKVYEIKVVKELTILSVNIQSKSNDFQCFLSNNQGQKVPLQSSSNNRFYGYFSPDNYTLIVQSNLTKSIAFSKKIELKLGLNTEYIDLLIEKELVITPKPKTAIIVNEKPEIKDTVSLNLTDHRLTIYFAQGDYKLDQNSEKQLKALSHYLETKTQAKIQIKGFTDDTGRIKDNKILSELRAMIIRNRLVQEGVTEERIITLGLGGDAPISANDTEENKSKNRRAEIQIINYE